MSGTIRLSEIHDDRVEPTHASTKLTINGKTRVYEVYSIDLSLLYYNDKNDRISTWMSKYRSDGGSIDPLDRESYNAVIQRFIEESNPEAMEATLNNIRLFQQKKPGVVLDDGRVIDGNRRFTCLRKLSKESSQFSHFEAVILEDYLDPGNRAIKTLELNLQLGDERPVDYDPVDRMYAAYRDIEVNGMFTVKDYAREANLKESEVKLMLRKAHLMTELLDFIGESGNYYIARELKLNGPLQEAVGVLDNCRDDDERRRMKDAIFASLYAAPDPDMTRYIRKLKNLAGTPQAEEFYEKMEEQTILLLERSDDIKAEADKAALALPAADPGEIPKTQSAVIKEIRSCDDIKNGMKEAAQSSTSLALSEACRDSPYEFLRKSWKEMERIDPELIPDMNDEARESFIRILEEMDRKIESYREQL